MSNAPIIFMNTSIMTADGSFTMKTVSLDEVKEFVDPDNFISAIGHAAASDVLTALFGFQIPENRFNAEQQVGQKVIALKINGRIPEGTILSREKMEEIGYTLKLIERVA